MRVDTTMCYCLLQKKKIKIERFFITLEFSTVCNETFLKDTMKSHLFTTLIFNKLYIFSNIHSSKQL